MFATEIIFFLCRIFREKINSFGRREISRLENVSKLHMEFKMLVLSLSSSFIVNSGFFFLFFSFVFFSLGWGVWWERARLQLYLYQKSFGYINGLSCLITSKQKVKLFKPGIYNFYCWFQLQEHVNYWSTAIADGSPEATTWTARGMCCFPSYRCLFQLCIRIEYLMKYGCRNPF